MQGFLLQINSSQVLLTEIKLRFLHSNTQRKFSLLIVTTGSAGEKCPLCIWLTPKQRRAVCVNGIWASSFRSHTSPAQDGAISLDCKPSCSNMRECCNTGESYTSSQLLGSYDIKSILVLDAKGVMLQDNTLDQTDPWAEAARWVSPSIILSQSLNLLRKGNYITVSHCSQLPEGVMQEQPPFKAPNTAELLQD